MFHDFGSLLQGRVVCYVDIFQSPHLLHFNITAPHIWHACIT